MGKKKHDIPVTRYAELREEYNEHHNELLSQKHMAKKCYTSVSTISRIENGTLEPPIDVIKGYSEVFNVSMEYLTGYSNSRNPQNSTIGHELGITDDVAKTLKKIKDMSSAEYDYTAVLNAFVNNENATFNFINEIFMFLNMEYQNKKINNPLVQTDNSFLISSITRYIESYVKPQLEPVLKKHFDNTETLSNIPIEEKL